MNPRVRAAIPWAIVGLVVVAGYALSRKLYLNPKSEILERISQARSATQAYEKASAERAAVRQALATYARRTLGAQQDQVEHLFRTALGDIATECGLADVSVSNGAARVEENPASQVRIQPALARALKGQRDFSVLPGDLSASGTLDQVLRCIAVVRAQPWVFRVDRFSIRPEGQERDRFELRMGVATIMMPDLAPREPTEFARVALTPAAAEAWRAIVEKNVFKKPPEAQLTENLPELAPVLPESAPAVPQSGREYAEWRLVGVMESPRQGIQAWLVNVKSGQRVELQIGQPVLDAVFLGGADGRASFRIGDKGYELGVGETLADRRPQG